MTERASVVQRINRVLASKRIKLTEFERLLTILKLTKEI